MTLYANYAAWVAGVKDWLDAAHLSDAQIGTFISLAQDRLNRDLAAWEMEATEDVGAYASLVPLPDDFNRIRQVSVDGAGIYQASTKGEIARRKASDDETERLFAIDAASVILWPTPIDGTAVTIDYFVKVPKISATAASNIFSSSYPDLLLWASLVEGSLFIVEDERGAIYEAKYQAGLKASNENPKKVKLGSTPLRRMVRAV